jgi:hypothetical protein
MSGCANITVLFRKAPDSEVLEALEALEQTLSNRTGVPVRHKEDDYERLVLVDEAAFART